MKSPKEILHERSPYLHPIDKFEQQVVNDISLPEMSRAWIKLESYTLGDFEVYRQIDGNAFIIGVETPNKFWVLVDLSIDKSHDIEPYGIHNMVKVDTVMAKELQGDKSFASKLYATIILNGYSLVSDIEQYRVAKKLWKSLARENDTFNVYIYDLYKKEYYSIGRNIVRYNGRNIPDSVIWGEDPEHWDMVLVATTTKLHTN
jgi:hypothetical protein